ncbi:MAG: DUF1361 domain-containing protein [Verrucomicrobiia bacterium]|jgi:uncharacterized membrane protein
MTHSIKTRARAILGILLQYPIRQLLMTVLALLLASALGVALFCARALVTQRLDYIFLVWNLILAWSPLFFSGSAALVYLWRGHKSFAFIGCAILWLLFLPNAPYIVTDFVHLRPRPPVPLWLDIFLIMSFAGTGLLLGFVSLNIMHRIAAHAYGWRTGWAFTAGALALCGFGLYLGRFIRLNSWELLLSPFYLVGKVIDATTRLAGDFRSQTFVLIAFAFLLGSYLLLYALTQFQITPAKICQSCGNDRQSADV